MVSAAAKALAHAQANREQYIDRFKEFLAIPSVSTDPAYKEDLERCGDWVVEEMSRIGLNNCRKIPTDGHPVVYGEWLEAGEDKPTVLIYAHYDVQPVDPLELWESPPFEPTFRDDKLFARGVVDDKAGVFFNLKAIESIMAADGHLPLNVKLFFEGEEEMGSPNMAPFVKANKELLKADALILCDGPFDTDQPSIAYALRGIVGAEVSITGPDRDLHSGAFGGAVHNPVHKAGQIIGSFHDKNGRIQIPGFYDPVKSLDEAEKAQMREVWKFRKEKFARESAVAHFWGGYQGPGLKTVLPSRAGFKVTMRIVADQNPHDVGHMFKEFVMGFAEETVQISVDVKVEAWPLTMALDGPALKAVQRTLQATLGKKAILIRGGGSIPIGGMFQHELGVEIASMGLGSGGGIHSPNEFMYQKDIGVAIDTAVHLYYNLADEMMG